MSLPSATWLSADQQHKAGVTPPWPYALADRVRFGELDALNHVNNVAYLQWFEVIRVHFFMAVGLTQYSGDDPHLVVRAQSVEYLKPLTLHAPYVLTAQMIRVGRTSFTMEYGCYSDGLSARSEATIVLLDPETGRPAPLPEAIRKRFQAEGQARI